VWPFFAFASRAQAAAFAFVPITIFSLLFMACSQVNHHGAEMSAGGAAAGGAAPPRNWYAHQVATSHTIAPASPFAFWISGGLNLQIEHHVLPTVNHWHLRRLQPAVEAAARKHGVAYPRSETIAEAFAKLYEHVSEMAREPKTAAK
jgi:fatty acid desaturase